MSIQSNKIARQEESFYADPHAILGLHPAGETQKIIRLWKPGASYVRFELFGKMVEAQKVGGEGLFERLVPPHTTCKDYRVYLYQGVLAHDPYVFWPTFSPFDAYLFGKGVHYQLYEVMGGRLCVHQGIAGAKFTLWAPNAHRVALVGDFNLWDGRAHPMRKMGTSGVWELFVPGLEPQEKYKFEIRTAKGALLLKADPYALFSERRPQTASILSNVDQHSWQDGAWMGQKRDRDAFPMLVYEVHLDSWKRRGEHSLNYRELAIELGNYCKKMGFTHVELMPLLEHPLDESWGYQVTGFFAVTSRMGSVQDFQFFIDHLHQMGIGVILDWVPAHFPMDEHALAQFDGTYLYEHEDPLRGIHPHWNTCIFNYGRSEVSNFLIASALFWLDKMHIDGLRVDAVASMLYLDYGREAGQWIPNCFGGNHNLEAIEWIKHLNAIIREKFPFAHRIAEESTSFLGVTHPLEQGGLGFTMKWNMGWMNDTLRYFHKDPLFRSFHQGDLTFALVYAFSERYILPLSHDEVVHGKASLLSKMPGDDWQKFASLRLLYSYQLTQVGKKLLFMGAELGQWEEWNCKQELPWHLLHFERHQQLQRFFQEINHFYLGCSALWEQDFNPQGFEWVDCSDRSNCVLSYLRKGHSKMVFVVHNFTPNYVPEYSIRLPFAASLKEVFNTDRKEYFGSDKLNSTVHNYKIQLAPLATLIFEVVSV